jgi:hypothetical protein
MNPTTLIVCLSALIASLFALSPLPGADVEQPSLVETANALHFEPGKKAPFLGVFTHLEPRHGMAEKLESLNPSFR